MTLVKPLRARRTSRVRCGGLAGDDDGAHALRCRHRSWRRRRCRLSPPSRRGALHRRSALINTYFFLSCQCPARRLMAGGATAIIMRTSSASEPASIFCMTCARWISTVRWLTPRSPATILFALPCVTRSSTSRSRGLRDARRSRIRSVWRRRARFSVSRDQRALHAIEQFLVAKRLLQEIEGAVLHGFDRHRDVAVAGDEDDRDRRAAQVQLVLHLEPAHARHAHVEHQAAGLRRVVARQEFLRGRARLRRVCPADLSSSLQRLRTASSSSTTNTVCGRSFMTELSWWAGRTK